MTILPVAMTWTALAALSVGVTLAPETLGDATREQSKPRRSRAKAAAVQTPPRAGVGLAETMATWGQR